MVDLRVVMETHTSSPQQVTHLLTGAILRR